MRQKITRTAFILTLLLTPALAGASPLLGLAGDLGIGSVDDTASATIQAGLDIQEGRLMITLFGRVRLMLHNHDEEGALRQRDWDEASDFVHILRTLRYSRQFSSVTLDAKMGEMLGHTLGHGTLMRDYSNISDPDHQHTGLTLRVSNERFEVEALLDNFVRPAVVALRGAVSPFKGRLRGLKLGGTVVMDPTAPVAVRSDDQGRRAVDSAYNLQSDTRVLALMGLDASYRLERKGLGSVEPYVDLGTSLMGMGVHLGAMGQLRVGQDGNIIVGLQGEYRYSSAGHAPAYFTTFYDVERHQAGLTFKDARKANAGHRNTKLAGMARGLYEGHGGLVQAGVQMGQRVRAKVGYGYRPGPDAHQLWLRLSAQPRQRLNLGVMLMMRGLESPHGVANGVVAAAEGRVRITDNLYGLAQYSRTWSLQERSRYFGVLQAFNISAGYRWGS